MSVNRIIDRADPAKRTITCEAATFAMALEGAVRVAEQYGMANTASGVIGRANHR